jgi:hypothetical protein
VTVFIVEECYAMDGCSIFAVFSTREKAEAWIEREREKHHATSQYEIVPRLVDELCG